MNSQEVLKLINVPARISSMADVQFLCEDPGRLTLIEMIFFENIQPVIHEICENHIKGDVVNIGVFRGGASLYMKSLFEEYGAYKEWWLFDSFSGFNESSLTKQKDITALNDIKENIRMPSGFPTISQVEDLFKSCNLGSDLHVVEGYIEDTLLHQDIQEVCFLHIDVDFYEPTYYALEKMYPRLSVNGWVVIDDYNAGIYSCKEAVDQFRDTFNITEPMIELGNYQVGWRKEK